MSCDGDSVSSWGYISSSSTGMQRESCGDGKARLWSRRLREKPLMSIVTCGEAGPSPHLGGVMMLG